MQKNIFMYWHDQRSIPPVAKFCIENCKRLNTGWNFHLIDGAECDALLSKDFKPEVLSTINVTQKSDVLRAKLLLDNGGVWMDATGLLHEPLDRWLGEYLTGEMTAPWDAHPSRVIGAWFIAARQGSPLIAKLYEVMRAYWSTSKMRLPTDQAWIDTIDASYLEYINDYSAHVLRVYPYFFVNYLFARQLAMDSDFAARFHACRLIKPAEHRGLSEVIRLMKAAGASKDQAFKQEKIEAAERFIREAQAPMSKLTWKQLSFEYPLNRFQRAIDHRTARPVSAVA